MLRISVNETRSQFRLVLEGKLIAPWASELRNEWAKARANLNGRELIVDLRNITTISQEGENVLLELMSSGVKFRCCGVFTRQVLKQLARRTTRNHQKVAK
jgi:anti-anti-sigma regulatory factor